MNVVDVPTYPPPDNDLHVPRQLHVQVEARGLSYEHQLLHMSVPNGRAGCVGRAFSMHVIRTWSFVIAWIKYK